MASPLFKLDFSPLRAPKPPDNLITTDVREGEHDLGGAQVMSPRANSERAITIRGAPKHRHALLFKLGPDVLGSSAFKFAWRPGGAFISTASMLRGDLILHLFSRNGSVQSQYNLGPGAVTWMEWDCSGSVLGLMQDGVGIFLWDMPPEGKPFEPPIALATQITVNATFCKWSKINQQLAIGTQQGKVILYNKGASVMQMHERKGKHGAPVTAGAWLGDNRLGLASGQRVKISQPIPKDSSKWESYAKFRLSGWLCKVPKHIRSAGAPNRLAFTSTHPPFVAVSVGDKYLLTFDSSRQHEDLGLTFPEDYGCLAGFQWMSKDVLLVGLQNGYVVTVDFGSLMKMQQSNKLPDRVSAMGTTRVFDEYLQDVNVSDPTTSGVSRIACCGDTMIKIVHRDGVELDVHAEIETGRVPTVGEFLDKVLWDDAAVGIACSSTNGHLYVYQLLS